MSVKEDAEKTRFIASYVTNTQSIDFYKYDACKSE